ncbi:flagellar hook-associated protein FlgL [Calycomorphotria hydatis]|uniref:Flagellar hook-associated protein 3 n=1 Tax=Calycomorphotria hydatis TaxID=2528027 RepID=A0A517TCN2_9PLAN|nr:flagellar hook-associated protein FlgL [Calycomorphotria hydatis]QDT66128.1 Flagellar hook-associated protein 3 [Calycomorphotria hydatis]
MPVSPILPGRIPGAMRADRLSSQIADLQQQLLRLQDMSSTGQRYFLPSEAPADAVRAIFFQREIEKNTQLRTNIQSDRSFLAVTETSLNSVADALNQTRSILLQGVGDTISPEEKEALATEVDSILAGVLNTANTQFQGRYLFAGSETGTAPFQDLGSGRVLYQGDSLTINSQIDLGFLLGNNVDGATAFGAYSEPVTADINPALTTSTEIDDLFGGVGLELGSIVVTLGDGTTPETQTIDLSGARTIGDIETRIEAAFAGAYTVDVAINGTNNGLSLTPGGTATEIAVADQQGSLTASQLGIASATAASITGPDLNPALTLQTSLTDLNAGAGATFTEGLQITSGTNSVTIDLSTATTVEDALNAIRYQSAAAGIQVDVGLNDAANGLSIRSRVSGETFTIGENGGDDATSLGIRTFSATTALADLNGGLGVPVDSGQTLNITRRDGSVVNVDLSTATTVQDVLDAVNAVDPGVLVASLNTSGNGIQLVDDDTVSVGPLSIEENELATALGLGGTENSGVSSAPLTGDDANPQESVGVFSLLSRLSAALRSEDDVELTRLGPLIEAELDRFATVRSDVANRLKTLDEVEQRLLDSEVTLRQSLSDAFDADLTEVITQVGNVQTTLQATLQIGANSLQLTLLNFL